MMEWAWWVAIEYLTGRASAQEEWWIDAKERYGKRASILT